MSVAALLGRLDSRVIRLGGGVLFASALSTLFAFLLQIFLSNTIEPAEYGRYAYVMTWVTILALASKLGLDTASLRFISIYSGAKEWGRLASFQRFTTRMVLGAAVGIALVTVIVAMLARSAFGSEYWPAVAIGCVAIPVLAMLELQGARLQAVGRPIGYQLIYGSGRPVFTAALVLGAATLWGTANASIALAATLTAAVIALIWVRLGAGRISPENAAPSGQDLKSEWIGTAWPLYLVAVSQILLQRADVVIVGALIGPEQVGSYFIASQLAMLVTFGISTVNSVVAPIIARSYASGDRQALEKALRDAMRLVLAYTVPVCLVLVLFGRPLLQLFGPVFADAYEPLLVLAAGQLVIAYCGPVGFLLTMTEHQRPALVVIASMAATQIVLASLMTLQWGLMGAAVAAACCNGARSVLLSFIVWRKLGIRARAL